MQSPDPAGMTPASQANAALQSVVLPDDLKIRAIASLYSPAYAAREALADLILALSTSPLLQQTLQEFLHQNAASPAQRTMAHFRSLLDDPKEETLFYIVRYLSNEAQMCDSPALAAQLYNAATRIPSTATRVRCAKQTGTVINGTFLPNVPSRSVLLYCFDHGYVPALVKVPAKLPSIEHELSMFNKLNDWEDNHLVGPLSLLELEGETEALGKATVGIKMPLYASTVEHIPVPMLETAALKCGKEISIALRLCHGKDLGHSDVKASNIFVDLRGSFHLGDYGAMQPFGADLMETTSKICPLHSPFDIDHSSAQLDRSQLAVTLLERLGHIELSHTAPAYEELQLALRKCSDPELVSLLQGLLE